MSLQDEQPTAQIFILGGYGTTGRQLAERLLRESAARLVLAGRTPAKAEQLARQLNGGLERPRVTAALADAADGESLRRALRGVDMVVVASSSAEHARTVATAALEAGSDYLDIQYAAEKTAILQELAPAIAAAGCCFITDGGFHPGLPAALVRYAAPCFDRLQQANVGSVIKIEWGSLALSAATMDEFVREFLDFQMLAYRDGRWQKTGALEMMKPSTMDFGRDFGRQYCLPMFLEEMRALPEQFPSLYETGFYVGGFNWVTDWLVSPLVMAGLKVAPVRGLRPLARLFRWSLDRFSRPPYGTMLKLEAEGEKDGRLKTTTLTLFHEDGYALTAIPVVATLLQWLDGSARRPGLHWQAHLVDPARLLQDMERMGVEVKVGDLKEVEEAR